MASQARSVGVDSGPKPGVTTWRIAFESTNQLDRAGVKEGELLRQGPINRSRSCRHRGPVSRKTDRHHRIRASARVGAAGAARPTFANGLEVS